MASTASDSAAEEGLQQLYPDLDFLLESQYLETVCGDWSDYLDDVSSTNDDDVGDHDTPEPSSIDEYCARIRRITVGALLHKFFLFIRKIFSSSSAFLTRKLYTTGQTQS